MIYLIQKSAGSYDDYYTDTLRAFQNKEDAEKAIEELIAEDIAKKVLLKEWQDKANIFQATYTNTPDYWVKWRVWYTDNPRPESVDRDTHYEILEMELE